jgi:Na+/melibiose symporter-like transporter
MDSELSQPAAPTAPPPASHRTGYASYGFLGLPLAMCTLPIYMQVPNYYTSYLGLTLASTGWILFFARLFDTLQDPILGHLIDRLGKHMSTWLLSAGIILALAFWGLWMPPASDYLAAWFALMLMITYSSHSMINIAYLAWGARIAPPDKSTDGALLGAAAWREGSGLVGVIIASIVPSLVMAGAGDLISTRMAWYGVAFGMILMLSIVVLLRLAPPWQPSAPAPHNHIDWRSAARAMAKNRAFRRLLTPYFLNALSVSIPATLALFFINDRLQASQSAATFLASYFISAAVGLPLWVKLAARTGVNRCWQFGIMLAMLAFFSAALLGPGDVVPYFIICVVAGLALGSDLALPPVLLAQVIEKHEAPAAYYGVWTLLGKLALSLSGLVLPLLAYFGYQSGMKAGPVLAWAYSGIPCVFKLFALLCLIKIKSSCTDGVQS